MKIVIDIPDEEYTTLSKMSEKEKVNELSYYEKIVANGIPLPKGHGDLISREWLKDAFDNLCCHDCKKCRNFRIEGCNFYKCNLIENAPTVERPQGEWKPLLLKTLNEEGGDIVAYESSCCGAVADKKYQHCPKCLTKMKGGAE